jgi:hypothetical protein
MVCAPVKLVLTEQSDVSQEESTIRQTGLVKLKKMSQFISKKTKVIC